MALKDLYSEYLAMKDRNSILSYSGSLNGELIASLLQLVENKLKEEGISRKPKRNLINILIECLQNIFYHSERIEDERSEKGHCLFVLGKEADAYFIRAGNYIQNNKVPSLQGKLQKIEPMSSTELHSYYLEVLDRGEISPKGGAGLGVIKIYREANQNVEYDFEEIDKDYTFFSMQVVVDMTTEN